MANMDITEVTHRIIDLSLSVGFIAYEVALGIFLLFALSYTTVLIFTFDFKNGRFVRPDGFPIIAVAFPLFLAATCAMGVIADRREFLGVRNPPLWLLEVGVSASGFMILLALASLIPIGLIITSLGLVAEAKNNEEKPNDEAKKSSSGRSAVSSGVDESSNKSEVERKEGKKTS